MQRLATFSDAGGVNKARDLRLEMTVVVLQNFAVMNFVMFTEYFQSVNERILMER